MNEKKKIVNNNIKYPYFKSIIQEPNLTKLKKKKIFSLEKYYKPQEKIIKVSSPPKFLKKKTAFFKVEEAQQKTKNKHRENCDNNGGRWTIKEHRQFLEGVKLYGINWRKITSLIDTRCAMQVRSHAQKFYQKMKLCKDEKLGIDFTLDSIKSIRDMINQMKLINQNYDIANIFLYLTNNIDNGKKHRRPYALENSKKKNSKKKVLFKKIVKNNKIDLNENVNNNKNNSLNEDLLLNKNLQTNSLDYNDLLNGMSQDYINNNDLNNNNINNDLNNNNILNNNNNNFIYNNSINNYINNYFINNNLSTLLNNYYSNELNNILLSNLLNNNNMNLNNNLFTFNTNNYYINDLPMINNLINPYYGNINTINNINILYNNDQLNNNLNNSNNYNIPINIPDIDDKSNLNVNFSNNVNNNMSTDM